MKTALVIVSVLLSALCATAATQTSKSKATTSTTTAPVIWGKATEPKVHFSTNLVGIINGESNVAANFFATEQVALSVSYLSTSEKASPIKKRPQDTGRFTLSSTQFGVGAAYYFFPIAKQWNISANPYLVAERRSDPFDTESNIGFAARADGLYRLNNIALNGGFTATSISGSTTGVVNAGVGYIF